MNDVALVLGGGGVAGVAWITGVVAGLADEGIDLRDVQPIGTSAGSTVGAQQWAASHRRAYARQADPAHQTPELSPPWSALRAFSVRSGHGADRRSGRTGTQISRMALDSDVVSEAERRAIIAGRLPSHAWPAKRFAATAIDAETGELRVFDAASGVDLVDAVAASCAVPMIWPATSIQGRRYVDGGMRSAENADLITGARSVLILSPSGIDAASLRGIGLRRQLHRSDSMRVRPSAGRRCAIGDRLQPARPRHAHPVRHGRTRQGGEATRIGAFLR